MSNLKTCDEIKDEIAVKHGFNKWSFLLIAVDSENKLIELENEAMETMLENRLSHFLDWYVKTTGIDDGDYITEQAIKDYLTTLKQNV